MKAEVEDAVHPLTAGPRGVQRQAEDGQCCVVVLGQHAQVDEVSVQRGQRVGEVRLQALQGRGEREEGSGRPVQGDGQAREHRRQRKEVGEAAEQHLLGGEAAEQVVAVQQQSGGQRCATSPLLLQLLVLLQGHLQPREEQLDEGVRVELRVDGAAVGQCVVDVGAALPQQLRRPLPLLHQPSQLLPTARATHLTRS